MADDDYLYSGLFEPSDDYGGADNEHRNHGNSSSGGGGMDPLGLYTDIDSPLSHPRNSSSHQPRSRSPDGHRSDSRRNMHELDRVMDPPHQTDRVANRDSERSGHSFTGMRSRSRTPPALHDYRKSGEYMYRKRSRSRDHSRRSRSRTPTYKRPAKSRSQSPSRDYYRRKKSSYGSSASSNKYASEHDLEAQCDEHLRKGLGSLWDDWQKHRRLCAMSQTRFIRHLLSLHKKYCVSRPSLADCGTQYDPIDQQIALTPGPYPPRSGQFNVPPPNAAFPLPSTAVPPNVPFPQQQQQFPPNQWQNQQNLNTFPNQQGNFPANNFGGANMFNTPPPNMAQQNLNRPFAPNTNMPMQNNPQFMNNANVQGFGVGNQQMGFNNNLQQQNHMGMTGQMGSNVNTMQQQSQLQQRAPFVVLSKNPVVRNYETGQSPFLQLNDIKGNVCDFAASQQGAKFLQEKIPYATPVQLDFMFQEVLEHKDPKLIMMNPFGNYFIQCLLIHGSPEQKGKLIDKTKGHINELANSKNGNRVVQKIFEVAESEAKISMAKEMEGHIIDLAKGYNGGFVVQKCINYVDSVHIHFIADEIKDHEVDLATDSQGCRVMQAFIEKFSAEQKEAVVDVLLRSVDRLATDRFGNYIVQHIMKYGMPHQQNVIITALKEKVGVLAADKFASNVMENCLGDAGPHERALLIDEVCNMSENEFLAMMQDNYANYVISKMLDVADPLQRKELMQRIKPHAEKLGSLKQCQKVVAKMNAYFENVQEMTDD